MKIEMCEQMVSSWLQNCVGCQVVQTNWTVSPAMEISSGDMQKLESFIDDVNATFKAKDIAVFKKSKPKQFVHQCEIDVVGIQLGDAVVEKIYLYDTAFHEGGLGYKDLVATVLKKIARAVVVADAVFKSLPAEIAFVAPFCRPSDEKKLINAVAYLEKIIKKYYFDNTVKLYLNDAFSNEICLPLLKQEQSIRTTNDLFSRSVKLLKTAEKAAPVLDVLYGGSKGKPNGTEIKTKTASAVTDNKTVVLDVLTDIISRGLMDETMLNNLTSSEFTNKSFGISTYPVLVKAADFSRTGFAEKRYYSGKATVIINGEEYRVCSQWIPEKIRRLKAWHQNL